VERLSVGDSVSYGRNYIAERPTWIATLPLGHADGYPRTAVNGCEVLIGGELYRVIGAVSASHTIVELGEDARVRVGNEATLIGPDHEAIHPNAISERAGVSVYDVLMHLSAALPRARVSA
jgi:alanine racemase